MSTIQRGFDPDTDRYAFDYGICSYRLGWAQVDTHQDASYFGIWTHPVSRMICTYAEGDVTVERCSDETDYRAALLRIITCYDRSERPCRIDVMALAVSHPIRDGLIALGMASYLH